MKKGFGFPERARQHRGVVRGEGILALHHAPLLLALVRGRVHRAVVARDALPALAHDHLSLAVAIRKMV